MVLESARLYKKLRIITEKTSAYLCTYATENYQTLGIGSTRREEHEGILSKFSVAK